MNLFAGIGQWNRFLTMTVGGAACGLIYHAILLLRAPLPNRLWITIPFDLLFSAASLAIFVVFCYKAAYLELRWYIFLGFSLGFSVIWIVLHSSVAKICLLVYNRVRKKAELRRERMRRQNRLE